MDARGLIWAIVGFGVGWWGWHNLRNNRNVALAYIAFFVGLIIWVYALDIMLHVS